MKMGGAESFEHVQKPATAIQDHVSSPNSIYKVRQACTFETKTSGLVSIQTVWHLNFDIVDLLKKQHLILKTPRDDKMS